MLNRCREFVRKHDTNITHIIVIGLLGSTPIVVTMIYGLLKTPFAPYMQSWSLFDVQYYPPSFEIILSVWYGAVLAAIVYGYATNQNMKTQKVLDKVESMVKLQDKLQSEKIQFFSKEYDGRLYHVIDALTRRMNLLPILEPHGIDKIRDLIIDTRDYMDRTMDAHIDRMDLFDIFGTSVAEKHKLLMIHNSTLDGDYEGKKQCKTKEDFVSWMTEAIRLCKDLKSAIEETAEIDKQRKSS